MRDAGRSGEPSGCWFHCEVHPERSAVNPHPSSLIPHPSSLIPHPSSLIPHPSLECHPNGDPNLVPDDDEERIEAAQATWHADVVGSA